MTMTLVSTVTVGSGGAASITWSDIPATGKDLFILASLRTNVEEYVGSCQLRINGVTTGYAGKNLQGNGSSVSTFNQSTSNISVQTNGSLSATNTFSNGLVYLANYTSATNKSISKDAVAEDNATAASLHIAAHSFASSSAITSLALSLSSGSFVQHSTASLYIIS